MSGLEHFFDIHTHNSLGAELSIVQAADDKEDVPNTFFSVGIHPETANLETKFDEDFRQKINHPNCLAIGEIGLDSRYDNHDAQEQCYISQLLLAKEFSKPIILHCVNQWDRCRFLHQKHASGIPLIYHGFNKPAILPAVLNYSDASISIGASVLTNQKLQSAVTEIPLSKLLVETDTSNVGIEVIYQKLADLKSLPLREFSERIYQNVQGIFKL